MNFAETFREGLLLRSLSILNVLSNVKAFFSTLDSFGFYTIVCIFLLE